MRFTLLTAAVFCFVTLFKLIRNLDLDHKSSFFARFSGLEDKASVQNLLTTRL